MGTSLADTSCSSVSPALLSTSSPGCNLDVDILSLLAARTGKMYPKHVEIFKKQLGCLNFPDDYHSYDGKTGQQLSKNLQRQSFNSHRVEILPCEMSYLSAIVFRSSLFLDRIHKIQCTWWGNEATVLHPAQGNGHILFLFFLQSCALMTRRARRNKEEATRSTKLHALKENTYSVVVCAVCMLWRHECQDAKL